MEYIKRELKEGNQIIVFCKNAKSCRAIDYFLNENNYQTASLHGEMTARVLLFFSFIIIIILFCLLFYFVYIFIFNSYYYLHFI